MRHFILDAKTEIAHSSTPKCGSVSLRQTLTPNYFLTNEQALKYDTRVMWIRDPMSRLWSAYHYCKKTYPKHRVEWQEFVDLVLSGEKMGTDSHWVPQHQFLTTDDGVFVPTHIHRFEDIADYWQLYSDRALLHMNKGVYTPEIPLYRDEELAIYYAEDYEIWIDCAE